MDTLLNALPSDLQTRLQMIVQTVPRFWEQKFHNHFTNHGPAHSKRVQRKLAQLAQELSGTHRLSRDEIFIVSAAAWLYEIGMQSQNLRPTLDFDYQPGDALSFSQLEEIRKNKHLLTERLILDSIRRDYRGFPLSLGLASQSDEYIGCIAEVCRWCSNEPLQDVPEVLPIKGEVVRIRLLVALLRLADQLYIDSSRVNLNLLQRFNLPLEQFARWWVYHYTQTSPIEGRKIRFHYILPSDHEKYLTPIRALFEPSFEYDNNPVIRYLWDEHDLPLMPHRTPTVRYDQLDDSQNKMSRELVEYLLRDKGKTPSDVPGTGKTTAPPVTPEPPLRKKSTMIKILFLAANPLDTDFLKLDKESRAIDEALRKAEFRDNFDIRQQWAVRVTDLQDHLLRHQPDIVHFSGHGSEASEIILEDNSGDSHPVSVRALGRLFSVLKDNIRCVVLNACYSEPQAQAIAEHIDCVIGMSESIQDVAAISFATAFYRALGYGKNVQDAFNLGCGQIDLENLEEQDIPRLLCIKGHPEEISFVHSR